MSALPGPTAAPAGVAPAVPATMQALVVLEPNRLEIREVATLNDPASGAIKIIVAP